jgi:transposase
VADILCRIIEEHPDATIDELTEELMTRVELDTHRSSVMRALQRLGFSRKKRPSPPSNATHRSDKRTGDRSADGC